MNTMTQTSATQQRSEQAADKNAVRPFHVNVSEAELTDLRRRIKPRGGRRRRPSRTRRRACRSRRSRTRALLGDGLRLAQVRGEAQRPAPVHTEIDGLDIHFIHVRSKHKGALPVIVTHGWPGSILEQIKLVGPLTDPRPSEAARRMLSTS